MEKKQLSVRLYGEPIGQLEQLQTGKVVFSYDKDAKQAISMSLPLREQPYSDLSCEAYFGGLLPESEHARKMIGKQFGISPRNTFALLKAIGYDCAGAISFHEMDDPIYAQRAFELDVKIVSENDLYDHIKILHQKPLFLGYEGLRSI